MADGAVRWLAGGFEKPLWLVDHMFSRALLLATLVLYNDIMIALLGYHWTSTMGENML